VFQWAETVHLEGNMRRTSWKFGVAPVIGLLMLAAPSVAAARPAVTTGAPANVAQTTATVTGTVDPNGAAAAYFFQYGPTRVYGAQSAEASAGAGNARVKVAADIGGLAPATTYHYRVVARGPGGGLVLGADRTFKTKRQPLGVTLVGSPNPVVAGRATSLVGALTGTGNAGRQVVLQANPFPYTQGFVTAGNAQVTDSAGGFGFPVLSVPVNTQFRVLMPAKPEVVSPIVIVGAAVRVSTRVRVRRFARTGIVRLAGRITPAVDGTQVLIQKFRDEQWTTIASTAARHASGGRSAYSKSMRQRRHGRYRVLVNAQGAYSPALGRTVRVRHVHR
jgi:hypothetical protein